MNQISRYDDVNNHSVPKLLAEMNAYCKQQLLDNVVSTLKIYIFIKKIISKSKSLPLEKKILLFACTFIYENVVSSSKICTHTCTNLTSFHSGETKLPETAYLLQYNLFKSLVLAQGGTES